MDKQWILQIKKRKVMIFGCGNNAKKFCEQYGDDLPVVGFYSNNTRENFFTFHNSTWNVIQPKPKDESTPYIIVCSKAFESISEQLILMGYKPFEDYIDEEMAGYLLNERKVILLYGFCHLRAIKDCLNHSKMFHQEYCAYYFSNYLPGTIYEKQALKFWIERCEILIYSQSLTLENSTINQILLSYLEKNIKALCIPAIYFSGYFPQKNRVGNKLNQYSIKCENHEYTPFSYEDGWLNECIDKGMTAQDVLEALYTETIYEKNFILDNLEKEWKRNYLMESKSDFKIVDYLEKNYKRKRLFRNEAHMENVVIEQYAKQIMDCLGLQDPLCFYHIEHPLLICSQHVIYPEVGNVLGLEWDVKTEKLDLYTYNGWKSVTMEEYINLYMEVCSHIKELKGKQMLP